MNHQQKIIEDLLKALERIAYSQQRANRRQKGMVDVFEITSLKRIALNAIDKVVGLVADPARKEVFK